MTGRCGYCRAQAICHALDFGPVCAPCLADNRRNAKSAPAPAGAGVLAHAPLGAHCSDCGTALGEILPSILFGAILCANCYCRRSKAAR